MLGSASKQRASDALPAVAREHRDPELRQAFGEPDVRNADQRQRLVVYAEYGVPFEVDPRDVLLDSRCRKHAAEPQAHVVQVQGKEVPLQLGPRCFAKAGGWNVQLPFAVPSRLGSEPAIHPPFVRTITETPLVSFTRRVSWPSARSLGSSAAAAVFLSRSVGPLRLPMFGRSMAACGSRFQSRTPRSTLVTSLMIAGPPAEPATR